MLDNRKKRILQAIVEEYIDTAEPVSSGNLVKELNCSSATIRNEMAELEKIGFIEKPYTSAGRIPSQKGYRYYIDELVRDDKLTVKEMQYIKSKLETTVNELEDLTKIATSTLSELTHYTTIAIGPKIESHTILDIKFVLLGSRVMMAIILTDSGIIREAIIKFDEDVVEEQIRNLNYMFSNKMVGRPLEELGDNIEEFVTKEMKNSISIIKKIIQEINKLFKENDDFILEGTNKSFDLPEFKKADLAKKFYECIRCKRPSSRSIKYRCSRRYKCIYRRRITR